MTTGLRDTGLRRQTRQFAAQAGAWRKELVVGLLPVLTGAALLHLAAGVPASVFAASLVAYGLLACMVVRTSPAAFHHKGPGLANRVTFLRAALVMPVAAMVLFPAHLDVGATYWLLVLAAIALALDGLDGAVARRTGRVTTFGARFDMELDALLILVLALLVWQTGQTGIWVLLIGLLRYIYVAAGWHWSWLQGELPPSRRRQTVCVLQSLALLVALAPVVAPGLASAVAFGALILLSYSFIVDVLWLYRQGRSLAGECR
jgi:phosphatidylglycerophosphate synthase